MLPHRLAVAPRGMKLLRVGELVLEPLVVAPAEAMFDVLREPLLYRHLDAAAPESLEELRTLYARREGGRSPDGTQTWLNWVVRPAGFAPIGYVQATITQSGPASVGFVFSSASWGRGLAFAATQAMLDHLAADCGVDRFVATVEQANLRSIRLLQRLGFRADATPQAHAGLLSPTELLFVMNRDEPRPIRPAAGGG